MIIISELLDLHGIWIHLHHFFLMILELSQGSQNMTTMQEEASGWFSRWHSFLRVSFVMMTWNDVSKSYVIGGPAFQVRQNPKAYNHLLLITGQMFFSIILKYLNILSYSYRTEINEKNRIYKKYTELFRKQISTLQILCILFIIIIINPPKSQWQGLTWIIMSYLCKFLFSVS